MKNTICTLRFILIYLVLILYHFDCFHIFFSPWWSKMFIVLFAHPSYIRRILTRRNDVDLKRKKVRTKKTLWAKRRTKPANDFFKYCVQNWVKINIQNYSVYSYRPENVKEVLLWNATPFEHIKLNAFSCTLK